MSFAKWVVVGLLILPIAEIVVILLVAALIGWLWVLFIVLASSLVGALVVRRSGVENLRRFRSAVEAEGIRGINLETPGLAAIVGGILLILPGFITDILGAALFVGPVRRWAAATFGWTIGRRRQRRADTGIIDLGPDDWRQLSETPIEDQRDPSGRR
jgi:UPF0716 protein FxsA